MEEDPMAGTEPPLVVTDGENFTKDKASVIGIGSQRIQTKKEITMCSPTDPT